MTMQLPDLISPILKTVAEENKTFPCYTNRASQLGYAVDALEGCLRRGVYQRTNWQDAEKHDPRVLLIFREGREQEKSVLKILAESGIEIIHQQEDYVWERYQISGHLDGVIIVEEKAIPVEIKSCNPNIFSSLNTFQDFDKKPWLRAYKCQIMLYMLHKNIDQGIFILKDKSSGMIKQINVELDYVLGEACIRTAEKINTHIANKTLPDRITDIDTCTMCPFRVLCLPGHSFGEPLKIGDDPEFEKKLDRYYELEDAKKEAKTLWDNLTGKMKSTATKDGVLGGLNIVIGKYHVVGKVGADGAFRTKVDVI